MATVNRVKLTQKMIQSLKPSTKETWIMDSEVIGLGVRQRPNAKDVYALRWKDSSGRDRKLALAHTSIPLEDIRKVARQRMGEIASGENPIDDRAKERHRQTVDDLVDLVVEDMISRGRSSKYIRDFRQQYRDHASAALGTMSVHAVASGDIDRVLRKVRGEVALHNRLRAGLSRMFKLSIRWGYRQDDPTFGAERTQERPRERLISDDELSRILSALDTVDRQTGDAIRLLAWTGSRPQELFSSKWSDFDLDAKVWTKPAMTVKQRRSHVVQLHDLAIATLRRMAEARDTTAEWVFPSHSKSGHLTTIKKGFKTVMANAGITEDTRPYDLRRAFVTRLVATGSDLRTVMSLTGHTQVSILMKHYAQAMPEKQREALSGLFVRSP